MTPRHLILAAAAGLVLGTGPAWSVEDGMAIVDPAVIRAVFSGHTIYGRNLQFGITEFRWSEYHCPNGRSLYVRGMEVFFGKWRVAGDEVCYAYPELNEGADSCFRLFDLGDERYRITYPEEEETGIVVQIDGRLPGDPFKIQQLLGASCIEQTS